MSATPEQLLDTLPPAPPGCEAGEPAAQFQQSRAVPVASPPLVEARPRRFGLFAAALDFVYPPACAICESPLSRGTGVCDDCRCELVDSSTNICLRCCAPVGPYLNTEQGCVHCLTDRFAFDRVLAAGVYDGPLRKAVLLAKHAHSTTVSRALAGLLLDRWEQGLRAARCDVVIPVPLHWTSRVARTQCAAEGVAVQLARRLGLPLDRNVLRKVRRTPPQSSLTPTQRRDNLKQAFRLSHGVRLDGCRVLLVDDVLTTGTTAHRAAQVLCRGGAEIVTVAVVARGLGR
jgi:ComF family protein